MPEHDHSHQHEEDASRRASRYNYVLGLAQLAIGSITRNFGFFPDATHNLGDGFSFRDKARATDEDNLPHAEGSRLRTRAAKILGATGLFGLAGGALQLKLGIHENTGALEVGAAVGSAVVNMLVAGIAHEHDHGDEQNSKAFNEVILHAYTDFGTSWAYALSLYGADVLSASNLPSAVIMANGLFTAGVAGYTLKNID